MKHTLEVVLIPPPPSPPTLIEKLGRLCVAALALVGAAHVFIVFPAMAMGLLARPAQHEACQ